MSGTVTRALVAVALLGALAAAASPLASDLLGRGVGSVRIAGEFRRVSRDALREAVREELAGGFFAVDVERVRRAALTLPWVREATVRRVWPDSIHIAVVERVAVARWNDDALLEDDASVFRPREGTSQYTHARLDGPPGSEAQVLEQFKRLATGFGTLAGGVRRLSLGARGQWELEFGNGMTLVPSTPLDAQRLEAFAHTLPEVLGDALARVARIDLRYANGFAVRWRAPRPQAQGDKG